MGPGRRNRVPQLSELNFDGGSGEEKIEKKVPRTSKNDHSAGTETGEGKRRKSPRAFQVDYHSVRPAREGRHDP